MNSGPLPRYHVLKESLRSEIQNGLYAPGSLIPSEKELQDRFLVSRTTVRRAIQDLVEEGVLDPQPGRGTYVRRPKLSSSLRRLWGFHEEMAALGFQPSVETLSAENIPADKVIAEKMRVAEGEPVWHLHRLQKIDGEPLALLHAYLVVSHVPALLQMLDKLSGSIYQTLRQSGVVLAGADEFLEAVLIQPLEAGYLCVKPGHAGLLIERVAYDQQDRVVEYSRRICRGDRYRYSTSLAG
jgi:GntR family transcriptional regulator